MNFETKYNTLTLTQKHVLIQYQHDKEKPKIVLLYRDKIDEIFDEIVIELKTNDTITIQVTNL